MARTSFDKRTNVIEDNRPFSMPFEDRRARSRSPQRTTQSTRRRSRPPHSHRHRHHHHAQHRSNVPKSTRPLSPTAQPMPPRPLVLPLKAGKLLRHDLQQYRPMFASYLDIQKQRDIDELDEDEIKGRWKSFVNRWYAFLRETRNTDERRRNC